MDGIESGDDRPALDVLQGWLVLLPFAALAIPGGSSLFVGATDTVSIGIGAMALGALPAVGLATFRGRGGHAIGLPALFVLLAFAAFQLPRCTDTFGAWRAMVGLAALVGWTVSVDPPGDTQPIAAQRVRMKHVDAVRLMVPRD